MDIESAKKELARLQLRMYAYNYAENVIYHDSVTVAPRDTSEGRGRALSILTEESYNLFVNDAVGELLAYLDANAAALTPSEARQVCELRRDYNDLKKVPVDEYVEYTVLINDAQSVWHRAKAESDFSIFRPYLERIVETMRRFAGYYDASKKPYDVWLDRFERGADMAELDPYFERLRASLTPIVADIANMPKPDDSFLYREYPIDRQRELSDYLMDVMGLDRAHCTIGETEHPFTINFNRSDVRITTHYCKNALASSMYSVIHEGGHALYDLGTDPQYDYTCLAGGSSMAVHESQSRFYENIIGRSQPFISFIFPKLKDLFPTQLDGVDDRAFCRAVNRAQPSLIRTEADELTYSLHIMIRYELEKRLMDGSLPVAELPAAWNDMYREYLGVTVPDDANGVLQDSHWSGGAIGYFPSYSLGSAYAAQMLRLMERDFDVWGDVRAGDLSRVTGWLRERIHRHGWFYEPRELLRRAAGPLDPDVYVDYLIGRAYGTGF